MQIEICFLNKEHRLACLFNGKFKSLDHAVDYARAVMLTAACREDFLSAELYRHGDQPIILASWPTGAAQRSVIVLPGGKRHVASRRTRVTDRLPNRSSH